MKYLLWKARVRAFIAEHYNDQKDWDNWSIWRESFLQNKSPDLAVSEAFECK
jgi:hypothetical protein